MTTPWDDPTESTYLPDGWIVAQSIDLRLGGFQYHLTGPSVPREMWFKFYRTREDAVCAARLALNGQSPAQPTSGAVK